MLNTFVERLAKIGITTTYIGNYPWIYLETVNGNKVTERYGANHGYHAFTQVDTKEYTIYDRAHLFKTIRKYM